MDREEILVLEEGNAIDGLVAELVMEWHQVADNYGRHYWADKDGHYMHSVAPENGRYSVGIFEDDEDHHLINWNPSTSIMWAWEVVEKIRSDLEPAEVIYFPHEKKWSCALSDMAIAHAETAPLAICRAALLEVENK